MVENTGFSLGESSSTTEESDSTSSQRNSSPDMPPRRSPEYPKFSQQLTSISNTRLSAKLGRLSPMVTGNASLKLQKQILSSKRAPGINDWGYDSSGPSLTPSSNSSLDSGTRGSPDFWEVRGTDRLNRLPPISQRKPLSLSAPTPSPRNPKSLIVGTNVNNMFDRLNDRIIVKILSFLNTSDIISCSRVCRRLYFLSWDSGLWKTITLEGENIEADLALKTITRLLARNSAKPSTIKINLNGCSTLTDRGLAVIARTCPQLDHLEVRDCVNISNGGLMDLVSRCQMISHLDVSGCQMVSTICVHQPPPSPPHRNIQGKLKLPSQIPNRLMHLQYLDLTDCTSVEDSGLKLVVENCPQIQYLFLRRCLEITDLGVKYVSSYCLHLRELSISDCTKVTDNGLFEISKLGPNLRYLSVAKCNQLTDTGIKQIARLCFKLRYLNIRGCESVSDEAIEMVARSCSRIRSLDIGKCDVTDAGLKLLSEFCPNLKRLSVKSCEMVGDVGVQSVAYYCRGLQQLNIQDCPVTVEGYRTVKRFCKKCIIEHTHPGFY